MFLSDVPPGASFKVIKVILGKEVGRRLADMGFTSGTEGAVVRGGFCAGLFRCGYAGMTSSSAVARRPVSRSNLLETGRRPRMPTASLGAVWDADIRDVVWDRASVRGLQAGRAAVPVAVRGAVCPILDPPKAAMTRKREAMINEH